MVPGNQLVASQRLQQAAAFGQADGQKAFAADDDVIFGEAIAGEAAEAIKSGARGQIGCDRAITSSHSLFERSAGRDG